MFCWTFTWLCLLKSIIAPSFKKISPFIISVRSHSQSAVTSGTCWWMNTFCFSVTALKLCGWEDGNSHTPCLCNYPSRFFLSPPSLVHRRFNPAHPPRAPPSVSDSVSRLALKAAAVNCTCNEFNQNGDLWDAASFLGGTFIFITTSHPFDFITAVSFTLNSHETPSY